MTTENSYFIVQKFIKLLEAKHKLTFEKDKEQYFRVLFDTYLNGQGNSNQLKDYIEAGIEDPHLINIIAEEVLQWRKMAEEHKAAEALKKNQKKLEQQKINQFAANRTKKLREEAQQERKERGQNPRKRHKADKPAAEKEEAKKSEGEEVIAQGAEGVEGAQPVQGQQLAEEEDEIEKKEKAGLKNVLQKEGKQKCRYYPFCKNFESCPYFHPSQRCTFFPHCRYGDACLYEHQACRFREKCTRPNCPYAHPFRAMDPIQSMLKKYMSHNNPLSKKKKFHKPNPNQAPKQEQPQDQVQ